MMFAKVQSLGFFGMETYLVEAEANIINGKSRFDIVGLPDAAVSEARERVEAAVKNSGFVFSYQHITVNLAPASKRKEGSAYDLPILMALLRALGQIRADLTDMAFIGELSLAGDVRPVKGVRRLGGDAAADLAHRPFRSPSRHERPFQHRGRGSGDRDRD